MESPVQTLSKISSMIRQQFDAAMGRGEVKSVAEGQQIAAGFEMLGEGMKLLREIELLFDKRAAERLAKAKAEQDAERAAADAAIDREAGRGDVIQSVAPPPLKLAPKCDDCDPKAKA